jgi:hypothetical protein
VDGLVRLGTHQRVQRAFETLHDADRPGRDLRSHAQTVVVSSGDALERDAVLIGGDR